MQVRDHQVDGTCCRWPRSAMLSLAGVWSLGLQAQCCGSHVGLTTGRGRGECSEKGTTQASSAKFEAGNTTPDAAREGLTDAISCNHFLQHHNERYPHPLNLFQLPLFKSTPG